MPKITFKHPLNPEGHPTYLVLVKSKVKTLSYWTDVNGSLIARNDPGPTERWTFARIPGAEPPDPNLWEECTFTYYRRRDNDRLTGRAVRP